MHLTVLAPALPREVEARVLNAIERTLAAHGLPLSDCAHALRLKRPAAAAARAIAAAEEAASQVMASAGLDHVPDVRVGVVDDDVPSRARRRPPTR